MGWIFENSSFLAYAIMSIFFIMVCFSYDTYDYLKYKVMYDAILFEGSMGYEFLYELMEKAGNYFGLTFEQFRMVVVGFEILLFQIAFKKIVGTNAFIWSVFIVYPGWILVPLFRFSIGLAFIIFGTVFLIETPSQDNLTPQTAQWSHLRYHLNSILFLACVAIASLFHDSLWAMSVFVMIRYIDQKKIMCGAIAVVFLIVILRDPQRIGSILSFLPIRISQLDEINSSQARSFNGLLFNTLKQGVVLAFGVFLVNMYQKEKNKEQPAKMEEQFMKYVLPVNYLSFLFLIVSVFSSNMRLTFFTVTYNLIACGICIKHADCIANKMALKTCALAFCMVLSVVMCKMESVEIFDFILRMIFETNDVINMYQQ